MRRYPKAPRSNATGPTPGRRQFRLKMGAFAPIERSIRIAAEYRRQIKAESVDVHLLLPIAQAVHHHLSHVRPGRNSKCCRCRNNWHKDLPGRRTTCNSPQRRSPCSCRSGPVVALASVVIYDVEHHADAGLMKSLHHVSEFEMLLVIVASARVLRMRREKVQGHVAPVVALCGSRWKIGISSTTVMPSSLRYGIFSTRPA